MDLHVPILAQAGNSSATAGEIGWNTWPDRHRGHAGGGGNVRSAQPARVPPNTCQASSDFATRLRMM